jgi:8-oxo-dGTP diphosphatase
MDSTVAAVHDLVTAISPVDALEAEHRLDTLRWLRSTDDVYRRVKPRTPARHLVSYLLLVDRDSASVLLVEHRGARLWLPAGGHVEPGENPVATAQRELNEELGIPAVFDSRFGAAPALITVTETAAAVDRHTDVSLWFVLEGCRSQELTPDPVEFHSVRWWSRAELSAADPAQFDPQLNRMLAKLDLPAIDG